MGLQSINKAANEKSKFEQETFNDSVFEGIRQYFKLKVEGRELLNNNIYEMIKVKIDSDDYKSAKKAAFLGGAVRCKFKV